MKRCDVHSLSQRVASAIPGWVNLWTLWSAVILLGILVCGQPFAEASELEAGALAQNGQLFEVHCAGCHAKGGNIVRRGKNLKLPVLKRNGYDSPEAIAQLIANGKNNMPAYRDRLTPEDIDKLAHYVLERAVSNWQ